MSGRATRPAGTRTEDCLAAAPDFDFSDYLDACRACIVGNADVAGLGIIVGILLQAALMNFCVALWWFAGPGLHGLGRDFLRLCNALWFLACSPTVLYRDLREDFTKFGAAIKAVESHDGLSHENLGEGRRNFRKKLQKLFRSWPDVQAVTGIALLFAAILQNNGGDLSLYHTAICLDLIAIAADGQAIMLFYAFKKDKTTISRPEERSNNLELPSSVGPSVEMTSPTVRERLLDVDHGIWPRLVSSLTYLVLDFIFSFKAFFRYRDSDECFLSSKPRTGNYGTWAIAGATLVLCVYIPIFVPQDFLSISLEKLGKLIKRRLAFLYDVPRVTGEHIPKEYRIFRFLKWWIKLIGACVVWIFGRFFEWILKREISFPIGTFTYFMWNAVDLATLKKTNQVLLVGGGEEEMSFAAFGQIVPIVMVFAVAYPICDVMQEKKVGDQREDSPRSSGREILEN